MTAIFDSENILLNISSDEVNDFISEYTLEGKWENVIMMYYVFPEQAYKALISESAGTALHVAIDLDEEDVVNQLVNAILTHHGSKPLEIGNEHGDTPLHFAASRGFARICKCIIGINNERIYLLSCKNKNGETPFFQAAVNWRKQAFAYLAHISKGMVNLQELLVRNDGDSILHTAIQGEHFDLAVIIANYYAFLSTHQNEEVSTPLYLLANKPSAFKSSSSLPWYKRILYYSIHVEPVDAERTMWSILREMEAPQIWIQTFGFPSNYITLCDFYQGLIAILSGKWFKKKKQPDIEDPSNDNRRPFNSENNLEGVLPPNYKTFRLFVRCISELTLRLFGDLKHIKIAKNNHIWSSQLLKALLKNAALTKRNYLDPVYILTVGTSRMIEEKSERDKMAYVKEKAPILVAARNGIYEMVKEILIEAPTALRSTNSSKQNVLLVAVEYRQILVVKTLRKILESKHWNSASSKQEKLWNSASSKREEFLNSASSEKEEILNSASSKREEFLNSASSEKEEILNSASSKKEKLWNSLILAKDDKQNTILHLAAEAQAVDKPGQNIARSALQMMWDMKWFQYIKSLVPEHLHLTSNNKGKTAENIFKESHEGLIKDSNEWLKNTADSCSVVAALVAGASFTTTSAVPGGTTEGRPVLEGNPAFNVFLFASLSGLCFSFTALIMFLSVLTSQKQAKDFRRDLPLKLYIGLSSLFVSIASMIVSFCTGYFFLLSHKFKSILFPIYAAACLPVVFYGAAQIPLYHYLLTAIFTKIPRAIDDVNIF